MSVGSDTTEPIGLSRSPSKVKKKKSEADNLLIITLSCFTNNIFVFLIKQPGSISAFMNVNSFFS